MNKEEIEYTIKTDRNTGEIVFSRGDYSFKQWGLKHEIIDLIEYLQQENKQLKEVINKAIEYYDENRSDKLLYLGEYRTYYSSDFIYKIIEILKGEDNE